MRKCKRCPQKATFRAVIELKSNPLKSHGISLCGNCLKAAAKNDEVLDYWPKDPKDYEKEKQPAQN